jgi:Saccharopine dehydrogenase NADP binding domain
MQDMISVVGATGYMGGLIVDNLTRRGLHVRAIGRDQARLAGLAAQHPGIATAIPERWDAEQLAAVMRGSDVVIGCAGPFKVAGAAVVDGAISAGAHYCDSTGEPAFIQSVFDRDAAASQAGVVLVPGFAFEFTLGDLGLAIASESFGPIARAMAVYSPGTPATSPAMRQTIFGMMADPASGIGRLSQTVTTAAGRVTGLNIPSGEALMGPRHVKVDSFTTYHVIGIPALAARAAGASMRLPVVGKRIARMAMRGAPGPSAADRDTDFACHVQVEAEDGRRRAILLEGHDAWGYAGRVLAELATRLATDWKGVTGARAPAEVVHPREFLNGLNVRISEAAPV